MSEGNLVKGLLDTGVGTSEPLLRPDHCSSSGDERDGSISPTGKRCADRALLQAKRHKNQPTADCGEVARLRKACSTSSQPDTADATTSFFAVYEESCARRRLYQESLKNNPTIEGNEDQGKQGITAAASAFSVVPPSRGYNNNSAVREPATLAFVTRAKNPQQPNDTSGFQKSLDTAIQSWSGGEGATPSQQATTTGITNGQPLSSRSRFEDAGQKEDFAAFPEVDEFGCVKAEDSGPDCDNGPIVDVALYNYECFYGMSHGTATFDLVQSTSAGIAGWAASVIQEGTKNPASKTKQDTLSEAEQKKQPENQVRRDAEEDRQLQMALLESIGACPSRAEAAFTYEDTYLSSNDYAYDSYSEDECSDSEEEDADAEEAEGEEEEETYVTKEDQQSSNVESTTPVACAPEVKGECSENCCADKPSAEEQPAGRRTVVRSSWQFKQLMSQVRNIADTRPTKDNDMPAPNQNSSRQSPDSVDDASWSQASLGSGGSTGSAVVVGKNMIDKHDSDNEETSGGWEYVEEAGVAKSQREDSDDDWSDVSCGGC